MVIKIRIYLIGNSTFLNIISKDSLYVLLFNIFTFFKEKCRKDYLLSGLKDFLLIADNMQKLLYLFITILCIKLPYYKHGITSHMILRRHSMLYIETAFAKKISESFKIFQTIINTIKDYND